MLAAPVFTAGIYYATGLMSRQHLSPLQPITGISILTPKDSDWLQRANVSMWCRGKQTPAASIRAGIEYAGTAFFIIILYNFLFFLKPNKPFKPYAQWGYISCD